MKTVVSPHHDPAPGLLAVFQGIPVTAGREKAALLGSIFKCGPKTHLILLASSICASGSEATSWSCFV